MGSMTLLALLVVSIETLVEICDGRPDLCISEHLIASERALTLAPNRERGADQEQSYSPKSLVVNIEQHCHLCYGRLLEWDNPWAACRV
jgi:hypothetical protein